MIAEPTIRSEWVVKAAKAVWAEIPGLNIRMSEKAAKSALTAVADDIRADALREMGDWFQLASQLGTGERDDIAAQACYDRADRLGDR